MKRLLLACAAASVLVLGACSAHPAIDLDEAYAWAEEQMAAAGDDNLGTATVTATPEDPVIQYANSVTLTFDEPATVSGFRLSCFGGGIVSTSIVVVVGPTGEGLLQDIECDGSEQRREYAATDVTEVTFNAASAVPTTAFMVIDG